MPGLVERLPSDAVHLKQSEFEEVRREIAIATAESIVHIWKACNFSFIRMPSLRFVNARCEMIHFPDSLQILLDCALLIAGSITGLQSISR
jgi:hypothetical protein